MKRLAYLAIMVVCGLATVIFGYFGARVLYVALTFEGEGSLGHVGMYLAAGLFPFFSLICAALTHLVWKAAGRAGMSMAE